MTQYPKLMTRHDISWCHGGLSVVRGGLSVFGHRSAYL